MGEKLFSNNGIVLSVGSGGSGGQTYHAGDGITIDDNYISVNAHTSGNIEGNGTTDNPITLKDIITLGTVNCDTVNGVKGNFGDVLIGRSDKLSVFIQKVKDLEDNQHEYTGGDHITVTDYIINLDDDVALKSDLPDLTPYALKTSLQDYVKTVDLDNYYTKEETFNKNEIIEMIDLQGYTGSDYIDISDDKVISVKGLHNTTVTSEDNSVTINEWEKDDGTVNYDLSVNLQDSDVWNLYAGTGISIVKDEMNKEIDISLDGKLPTIMGVGRGGMNVYDKMTFTDLYDGQGGKHVSIARTRADGTQSSVDCGYTISESDREKIAKIGEQYDYTYAVFPGAQYGNTNKIEARYFDTHKVVDGIIRIHVEGGSVTIMPLYTEDDASITSESNWDKASKNVNMVESMDDGFVTLPFHWEHENGIKAIGIKGSTGVISYVAQCVLHGSN